MAKTPQPAQAGGYPVISDELAAVFLSLGFKLRPGGVAQFVSERNPKSKGGEKAWLFEGWSDGASAVEVQKSFEECGDGAAPPDAYIKVNELLGEIGSLDIPDHIKARLVSALKAIFPEAAAAACGLFAKHLVQIHLDERPLFTKIKTGETSYEIRRAASN